MEPSTLDKKIDSPNVWWIVGADHVTFEGVMGDFKKMSYRLTSRGKEHANKFLGEKHPALKKISLIKCNAKKKSYTVISRGKNF